MCHTTDIPLPTAAGAGVSEMGTRATVPVGGGAAGGDADRRVTNVGAERALMRIKQKLDGTEYSMCVVCVVGKGGSIVLSVAACIV